ncbi:MAG: hypothetical protein JNK82_43650 [Myxococcaceae bacterium]|nr:hypothetical protein [Myxococcaceae bacterium]
MSRKWPKFDKLSRIVTALSLAACEGYVTDLGDESPGLAARLQSDEGVVESRLVTGTAAMGVARRGAQALTLPDGRVLVVGGQDTFGNGVARMELYSVHRNLWSNGPLLPVVPSRFVRSALLPGGRVLVVDDSGVFTANLATGAVVAASPPGGPIGDPALATLTTGEVLVLGRSGAATAAWRFTPGTPNDTWAAVAAPPLSGFMSATRLSDGRVFASSSNAAAIFSPATGTWQPAAASPVSRVRPQLFGLSGARVAAVDTDFCGVHHCDRAIDVYSADTNSWATVDMQEGHMQGAAAALLEDGRTLVVAGGVKWPVVNGAFTTQQVGARVEWVDLDTMQLKDPWNQESLSQPRAGIAGALTTDGRLLVAGGSDGVFGGNLVSGTELVAQRVATFEPTLGVPTCRSAFSGGCTSYAMGRGTRRPEVGTPNALKTAGVTCADGNSGTYLADESIEAVRVYSATGDSMTRGGQVNVLVDVWAWSAFTTDKLDIFIAADAANPTWQLVATRTPTRAGLNTLTATATIPSGFASLAAVRAQFRYQGSATACAAGPYNDRDDVAFEVY